jgi:ferrous-iron efflux pump FieF
LVTLFGVRIAAMPADHDHRFGHGKAESLAALIQVGIIGVSAIGIGWRAIERMLVGARTDNAEAGIAVSAIAIVATLALIAYQTSVVRRTGSVAIGTDRLHYQSDLFLNLSVIAALALDQYAGFTGADPLLGLGIALWLLFGAWTASRHAIDQLMDKEWPEERRRAFVAVAARHPDGRGLHDLRTRSSGTQDFAQFHMWVDPEMTMSRAHQVMDEIEAALAREFPGVEILIHLDPEGQVDQPDNPLAERDETAGLPD